ncbi:hypothetical protein L1987_54564 [Smallanthus sonchifolius]|uniref:Uncharacterized protein n=1 Tax=Smallanthus sonchifolius TaxID=185202 RepID=A0ACB9E857_9ASTR|nr:hypothetical protein L1987_54564 [Smallanthus sonchifolius]
MPPYTPARRMLPPSEPTSPPPPVIAITTETTIPIREPFAAPPPRVPPPLSPMAAECLPAQPPPDHWPCSPFRSPYIKQNPNWNTPHRSPLLVAVVHHRGAGHLHFKNYHHHR